MKAPQIISHGLVFGFALLAAGVASGQSVIVESRAAGGALTPCPPYCEVSGSWFNSSAKSSASGLTGTGSRWTDRTAGNPTITISPALQPGQVYRMEVTIPNFTSVSADLVCNVAYGNCTGSATTTAAFQYGAGRNGWNLVGTITNNSSGAQPEITFTYASGTISQSPSLRWYLDGVRFVSLADPCTTALPELSVVNGPLAASQTFVDVPGVTNLATAVSVYANGVKIGAKTNGITAGVNRVITAPLVKSQIITVTQTDSLGVESCRPTAGTLVGGGANPRIRVSLSIRQNVALTGPIGGNGGTTPAQLKFLGATNVFGGGFGLAPMGGRVVQPETCWQTVSFLRGPDPVNPTDKSYAWSNSDGSNNLAGTFGALESVAFAIDNLTDSGPFLIYVDNLMNGDTLIQDFENATNGQNTVLFNQPGFSGSTTPYLLAQSPGSTTPNISQVSTNYADTGEKSLLVNFQFKDVAGGNWLRLTTQGSGTPNPIVDLSKPISFRILLLPVGQTNIPLRITASPPPTGVMQGSPASLLVEACGMPPVQYQWYFNNSPLAGATNHAFNLASVQPADMGQYFVIVSDPSGSVTSSPAMLSVEATAISGMMTQVWALHPTNHAGLAADGQNGGLAYLPRFNSLVLVTRSGSDSIRSLSIATGAEDHETAWNEGVVSGGLYRFHKVGCLSDGNMFTGNVTTNGAVDEFRLYQSLGDFILGDLAWHGNPGGAGDTNRWGDTMDVRDYGAPLSGRIILGSHAGTKVAVLTPALSTTAGITFSVPGVPAGAFAHGISWGEGDTFWGKSFNGALYHVGLNFTSGVATVLHTYYTVPSLGAIEVDPVNQLLGGVSLGNPNSLRIYDIANLAAGPVPLDAAPFPANNPNPSAVGSVAFANNHVYALSGNNGILAMRLRPLVRAVKGPGLVINWTGAGTLQSATNVAGIYTDVPGAVSPFPVNTSGTGQLFYRVRE